ncbi:EF-hand calcium-binding domain-containing protein 4B [Stylophora pistillata]|uniref:EF-hand calcium-binding domain-containing protein 4B n=2 Tax=Stylophora pistillata TaxID=50429 RepID=A0A2B4RMB5_STYPI|nr:EF-hand calcium-binding domain-containing protein 4B [Stylophora pistillata]
MAEDPDQLKNVLKERAVELFNLCDQDGKGYITESELQHVIAELGLPLDASQVKQTFNELDYDENGYLTLEEFTAGFGLFLGIQSNDEGNNDLNEITSVSDPGRELFFLCDPEGKGYITKVDLERVAGDLNLNFEQLDFIFDKLDIDKNGRLTLEEFVEGFGTFLSEGNGSTEHDSSKHVDGDLNDEFTKQSLPEGHDIFESLETGPESPNYASEEALFRGIVESVGEDIFSGSLTKDQLRDLWEALRKNDVRGLQKFEEFLGKVCGEIRRAKIDSEQLESALKRKCIGNSIENMHTDVRQIKREKALKDELVQELENKELEMQLLMQKQKSLEDEIQKKHETEQDIKSENEKLFQKTMHLEEMLNNSVSSLEDTKSYVNQLQAQTALEKKERARND